MKPTAADDGVPSTNASDVAASPSAGDEWCDLCRDNWLFVLGAGGRTGSTTALFMFRQIPRFELSGEHFGVLKYQMEMLDALARLEDPRYQSHAFVHKPIDTNRILCGVQDVAKAMVLGEEANHSKTEPKVIGFKEIRYANPEMLRFLGKVFPCARYVFTYRQDEHAPIHAASFQERAGKQGLHSIWQRTRSAAEVMQSHFNQTSRMLAVEDSSADKYNDALMGLLGVKGCTFESILHENSDGGYSRGAMTTPSTLKGVCDTSAVDFSLAPSQIRRNEEIREQMFPSRHSNGDL